MSNFDIDRKDYEPFEVTIVLGGDGSMLSPDSPIHLDSILASLAVEKARIEEHTNPLSKQFDLPLAKAESENGWCYCASALDINIKHRETEYLTRRNNDELLRTNEALSKPFGKMEGAKGQYKNVFIHQNIIYPTIKAFGIGDIDEVDALLGRLTHIGSKRGNGHGKVRSYQITEVLEKECKWIHRRVPFPVKGYAKIIGTCRPWYADRLAKELIYTPKSLG
jgi:CRISPR type IV-associated protein Csf3